MFEIFIRTVPIPFRTERKISIYLPKAVTINT